MAAAPRPARLADLDWRWALPRIALVFIVTRLLVLLVAFTAEAYGPPVEDVTVDDRPVVSRLTAWDGVYYVGIADDGYHAEFETYPDYAFFPGYPVTVRATSLLTGGDIPLAAVLASNLAFALALVALYALSVRYLTRERAVLALWFLALAPGAVAFAFGYSESLFLFLAVSACLAAEHQRHWLAGLVLAAAAWTRVPGLLMVLPVVALYVGRDGWRPTRAWLPLVLAPLATAIHFGLVWTVTGDPLGPMSAQFYWNVPTEGATTLADTLGGEELTLLGVLSHPAVLSSLLLVPFYLFLFVFFRHDRIRPAYWLVSILSFVAIIGGASPFSNARFLAVAWPFSWVLAGRSSRAGQGIVLAAFTMGHVALLWFALTAQVAP